MKICSIVCLLVAMAGMARGETLFQPLVTPRPVVVVSSNRIFHFECRSNGLMRIDVDGLEASFLKAAKASKALREAESGVRMSRDEMDAGDANYKIDIGMSAVGIMALQIRDAAHPEAVEDLRKADSAFKQFLKELDPRNDVLVFYVRGDSVQTYRAVRSIAMNSGFQTSWELLDAREPITFMRPLKMPGRNKDNDK